MMGAWANIMEKTKPSHEPQAVPDDPRSGPQDHDGHEGLGPPIQHEAKGCH